MPLSTIRRLFVEATGRDDLVVDTTNYVDSGANHFIQAGNRLLDDMQLLLVPQDGTYRTDVEIGDWYVSVPDLRYANTVWATKVSNGTRTKLTRKSNDWIRENYNADPANVTNGCPTYWTQANAHIPLQQDLTLVPPPSGDFSADYADVEFQQVSQRRIIIMPPADADYTITIQGGYYGRLIDDTDKTYWSEARPELLVLAAQCSLEMFYRNTQGVNDMMNNIRLLTRGIYHNSVQEMSHNINQIKG